MNEQQRAAMQMAWEYIDWMLSGNLSEPAHEALDVEAALREALAQPQGEWVDLTDDEILNGLLKWRHGEYELQIAYAAIHMFKEKNTPPVMPQGEPVAWYYKQTHVYLQNACDAVYIERVVDKPKSWEEHPLYFAPPSSQRADALVEAAIEATKERAAHIVVGWTSCGPTTETDRVLEKIIAAIRSMK